MWKSLIWKEWHEQRWKLGFGCVLLMTITFVGLRTRMMPDDGIMGLVAILGAVLLPLLNAMGLVAAEREDGSFNTLMRLPAPVVAIYAVKSLMSLAIVVLPVLGSGLIAFLMAGDREMTSSRLLALFGLSAFAATAVFLWTSVAGIRQPTEARAAVAGVAILAVWLVALALTLMMTHDEQHWIVALSPLGSIISIDVPQKGLAITLAQLAIMSVLWLWGFRRFARPIKAA